MWEARLKLLEELTKRNNLVEVERSIQNIQLDYNQLLSLVRTAFPNCQRLDKWELLSGGANNTIYKIQTGPESFVIRLYARDRALCIREKAIYQLITPSVSTPKLIYTYEDYEPWAYSLFEFVSGVQISKALSQEKFHISYELGRLLASIHAYKLPQAGLFGDGITISHPFEMGSSPYFEKTISVLSQEGLVRHRLGPRLVEEAITFIQKNKDFFPIVSDNICLTHSDFKPVNILYTSNKKIFVVDWEFAHAGIGILDFSLLLRDRHQFPLNLAALQKGYLDFGGTLPDEWIRSATITDFVNMATLLETPGERPKLFQELKNAMQHTMHHWDLIPNL